MSRPSHTSDGPQLGTGREGSDAAQAGSGASIDDYIMLVHDALPVRVCEALLGEFGPSGEWNPTAVSSGRVEPGIRKADAIALSDGSVIAHNPQTRQQLDQDLFTGCTNVVRQYNQLFPHCQVRRDSGFALLRYRVGDFYSEHPDSNAAVPRELSCSFLINDDFSGGEFAFFGGRRVFTMRRGDAIVFPSNFMYPHQILPVTAGTRYSVVTWFL